MHSGREVFERLNAALIERYRVEREIGSGGMATVYLAEDLKHRRRVAIKVLRPELAGTLGPERFLREIEIAARLSHPHILPLHDSGEAEGILYYVMPYVEGESLRRRLDREGKLSVAEAVRLADEIASALTYAHEQGIVHRDIKPENIMLSGGRVVVADFGIARAVSAAGGDRLTGTGFAAGTPAYMSPEQAYGDAEVDGRSDVYALGCVMHEMVFGHPPFEGGSPRAVLAKHAVEIAPSLRARDPRIPLFVDRAVGRALAKSPEERFQTADAFAEALTKERVVPRVRRWSGRRLALAGAGAAVMLAAAIWGQQTFLAGPAYQRLAVLPPINLMNDPEQEHLVQGVHNALISELQLAGVPVIARTSVLQYGNTQKTIRQIADELGVDAILEPSLLRSADSVELEVRLVDGSTQRYVADPIVRHGAIRDIESIYRDLTGAIATEIHAALAPRAEARLASAREVDPQAYEAYLKGEFYAGKLSPPALETALHYFERARDLDPEYALAYVGIAKVWNRRSQMGIVPESIAAPQAQAATARALALDSTLAEVQYVAASLAKRAWDWGRTEAAYRKALELNPNSPDVLAFYGNFLSAMGRHDEAIPKIERAVELDPLNPLVRALYGTSLLMERRYEEAGTEYRRVLRIAPNHPVALSCLEKVYVAQGRYDEAMQTTGTLWAYMGYEGVDEALARGFESGGYRGAYCAAADHVAALSAETYVPPNEVADLYALAGEDGLALDWLERSFEEHNPNLPYLNAFPTYDRLREEPRFRDLVRRVGLPRLDVDPEHPSSRR